jgi:hypothetical protein
MTRYVRYCRCLKDVVTSCGYTFRIIHGIFIKWIKTTNSKTIDDCIELTSIIERFFKQRTKVMDVLSRVSFLLVASTRLLPLAFHGAKNTHVAGLKNRTAIPIYSLCILKLEHRQLTLY